jgi:putative MATE family efflux protein
MATTVLIAQAFGAKDMATVKKGLTNSFLASIILCVVISVFSVLFSRPLLALVNTPPAIRHDANIFFSISAAGIVFQFIYNWLSGILRGLGDSKTPLYLMIVSTVLNIILVPVLIIGPGPLPAMGIAGAAVGTIVATMISVAAGYLYSRRKNPLFDVRNWDFKIDWTIVRRIFTIGIPASLQMIVTSTSATILVALVNRFGADVTAAYGIGMQIDQVAFLPAMTIGIAISSMAGQNLGVAKYDRVRRILLVSGLLSLAFSLVFCGVMFFFPAAVAGLFTKNDHVIAHAAGYFHIVCFTYVTYAIMFALQGVVRASGDTLTMLLMTVIAIILFRIPLAYGLSEWTPLKEHGIWMAMLISTMVGMLLNYLYYVSGRWKRVRLMHPKAPAPAPEAAATEAVSAEI